MQSIQWIPDLPHIFFQPNTQLGSFSSLDTVKPNQAPRSLQDALGSLMHVPVPPGDNQLVLESR